MANFVYTHAAAELLKGNIDLDDGGDDIRVLLVDGDTTADTEKDVDNISAFSTLSEISADGYSRQAIANEAVAEDEANDRGEFDGDDVSFTFTADPGAIAAAVVFKHDTDDDSSVPLAYIDDGFPVSPGANTLTIEWNAEGIIQATTT